MNLTIRDIVHMPEMKGLKLIAGEKGYDNIVTRCGLLDYEYDNDLKEKFLHRHFLNGQFVLTSFLYAKNNEFHVGDAVKRLHQRGCSGLAIKNIYRINIRENVLRFADANNFPIFIITDSKLYFEDIIFNVTKQIMDSENLYQTAHLVDEILYNAQNDEQTEQLARSINPSFKEGLVSIFFRFPEPLDPNLFLRIFREDDIIRHIQYSDRLFYYKGGIMLIHSTEINHQKDIYDEIGRYIEIMTHELEPPVTIGVSRIHHQLSEFRDLIEESLIASFSPASAEKGYHNYHDIGLFQLFVPLAREKKSIEFKDRYIQPLQVYDTEHETHLLDTARYYILNNGNIEQTAKELNLHINTIRYRIDTINYLLKMNVLSKSGYSVLSAAIHLYLSQAMTALL